jgi:integrase
MIELFFKNLRKTNVSGYKANGKTEGEISKLSSTTVRHVYFILKKAFDKAVEWSFIKSNPILIPAPSKNKANRSIWDGATVREVLSNISHRQLHLAVHLSFICSLRIGEAMALTWDCVDFENNMIKINKTIQRVTKEALEQVPSEQLIKAFSPKIEDKKSVLILKKPKTESSERIIYLTMPLRDELLERLVSVQRKIDPMLTRRRQTQKP